MISHLKSGQGSHLQNAVQTSAVTQGCFDCSYPLDVARRNMQLSMMYPEMNKFRWDNLPISPVALGTTLDG